MTQPSSETTQAARALDNVDADARQHVLRLTAFDPAAAIDAVSHALKQWRPDLQNLRLHRRARVFELDCTISCEGC